MRPALVPLVLCLGLCPLAALAEPSALDRQVAQSLFDSARRLMKDGKYAEACSKFEESQKLDPGGGTLLNLAVCHEKLGRLATAYAEFNESLSLALAAGRADRQKTASDAIAALGPRLPRLRLAVREPSPDLSLSVDEQPLPRAAWAVPTPFDPGRHRLLARAAGREPWSQEVELREAQTLDVTIPELAPAPPPPPSAAPPPSSAPSAIPAPSASASAPPAALPPCKNGTLVSGVCVPSRVTVVREVDPLSKQALGATAIVSLTAGLLVGAIALGLKNAAHCTPAERRCDDQASLDRAHDARSLAWLSTIATGVAVASGVGYFLIPRRRVEVDFSLAPAGVQVAVGGRWP